MPPSKSFTVFGEPVEILIPGELTGGLSTTLIHTAFPGGGPPPHSHTREDETFYPLEGDFEIFDGKDWHKIKPGHAAHYRRGAVHTFRNAGSTTGRILIFVAPAGLDKYLEEISILTVPQDMDKVIAISARYGITFQT